MNIKEMTVSQVQSWVQQADREEFRRWLPELEQDERAGIRQLVRKWYRGEQRLQQQRLHWEKITRTETELRSQGMVNIAGLDEAGRGPLAGPVVAAAVMLPADFVLVELNDSKQLSAVQRERMARIIQQEAVDYTLTYIHAEEVDQINIYQATKKAMNQSLLSLRHSPDYALIDALELSVPIPQKAMIKGDARSASIAAASIVAKVSRDQWMTQMAAQFPEYGFERNKGYATREHLDALRQHGPTPIHRRSFLNRYINDQTDT